MAPLPVSENASAVALVTFVRAFAAAWGVSVAGTILQNRLLRNLPPDVLALFPQASRGELAYAVIPRIASLPPAQREATQLAFAESMRTVWVVMSVLCGVGLLTVALMKEFSLRKTTDKNWGLKEKEDTTDEEKVAVDTDLVQEKQEVVDYAPELTTAQHSSDRCIEANQHATSATGRPAVQHGSKGETDEPLGAAEMIQELHASHYESALTESEVITATGVDEQQV